MELNLTWGFTLISFLVLYGVLFKLLYRPIQQIMEERASRIKEAIDEAENARTEAERLLKDYKEQISGARKEAQNILEQAKTLGEATREDLKAKAEEEAEKILTKTTAEIEREKTRALSELQGRVADLAVGAASAIVGKSLDAKDHSKMIEEYLEQAETAKNN